MGLVFQCQIGWQPPISYKEKLRTRESKSPDQLGKTGWVDSSPTEAEVLLRETLNPQLL